MNFLLIVHQPLLYQPGTLLVMTCCSVLLSTLTFNTHKTLWCYRYLASPEFPDQVAVQSINVSLWV